MSRKTTTKTCPKPKRRRPAGFGKGKKRGNPNVGFQKPSTSKKGSQGPQSIMEIDFSRMKEPDYMRHTKFNCFIRKLKNKVSPSIEISYDSMRVLDCWMKGMLHQIGVEASNRMGRRKVLKPKILYRALKKVLPKSIRLEAHERGKQALHRYGKSTGGRSRVGKM